MSVAMAGAGLPAGGSHHHRRAWARFGGIKFGAAFFGWKIDRAEAGPALPADQ